jgi:hypothetical protein
MAKIFLVPDPDIVFDILKLLNQSEHGSLGNLDVPPRGYQLRKSRVGKPHLLESKRRGPLDSKGDKDKRYGRVIRTHSWK